MRKRASLIDIIPTLKALTHVERKKLIEKVHCLDKILPNSETKGITELNDTFLACTFIATEKSNKSICNGNEQARRKEWLLTKVERLKSDVSSIVECRKRPCKKRIRVKLEKKHKIRNKDFDIVIVELKQGIEAIAQKIKWFSERNKQYRENRMFVNNQRQFY